MKSGAGSLAIVGTVAVFRADPDLLAGVSSERGRAVRDVLVSELSLPPRGWSPPKRGQAFAYLVLSGSIARETRIPGGRSVELLGPGDIVAMECDDDSMIPSEQQWVALEPARLAVLDQHFLESAVAAPSVLVNLTRRVNERAERNLVQASIAGVSPIRRRVELMFWHLADRWGVRKRGAIEIPLRLTQVTVAALAATTPETVSRAYVELVARGALERIPGKQIRLMGRPPSQSLELIEKAEETLRQLRADRVCDGRSAKC